MLSGHNAHPGENPRCQHGGCHGCRFIRFRPGSRLLPPRLRLDGGLNSFMTVSHPHAALVLGGARSGKSRHAEKLAHDSGLERHYIATGRAFDDEMQARIDSHRAERGDLWTTHEEPLDLVGTLSSVDAPGRVILVDCLTLWVTNLMMAERDVEAEGRALAAHLPRAKARLIFVSNEVGLGIVPENRMAREFRDHAGRLHQRMAAEAQDVYFIAAGLPLKMKG